MQALQTDVKPLNRRNIPRFPYREPFTVGAGGHVFCIDAYNISKGGICGEIRDAGRLEEGREVEIYLHDYQPVSGYVRWSRGREVGLIFTEDLANHPRIRALLSRIENGEPAVPDRPV